MRTTTLLPLLLSIFTIAKAFTCDTTTAQALPICCGQYYPYDTPSTPSPSPFYYAILCAPAIKSNGTLESYECKTTGNSLKAGCCSLVSSERCI